MRKMESQSRTALPRWLDRLDRMIGAFERAVLTISVLGMAAVAIVNVLSRNILGESLSFAEEVMQILLVLVTFVGIGYGVRHARHIRMSALYDQLRGRVRKAALVTIDLGTAALLVVLAWYGVDYVWSVYQTGNVSPALRLPLYLVYLWVPVGFLLGALQYVLTAWRNLTTPGIWRSLREEEAYASADES